MKKTLLLLLLLPVFANAQYFVGPATGSTTFTFSAADSFTHSLASIHGLSTVTVDTSGATLWQIGNTLKPIFSNTVTPVHGIMTDTQSYYPKNANRFFVLKMAHPVNCVVDLWHKYQTDSLHAGGLVEFSTDSSTWVNIAACPGIETQNYYSEADTLGSGQPAFMGTSNGEQLSRFQLMNCWLVKTTATTCFPSFGGSTPVYIRFRFVSDSTTDSLSGWLIDSIRVSYNICPGSVSKITAENKISIFPNPAYGLLTITSPEVITNITITNLIGQTVYTHEYKTEKVEVNIANLPAGVYFIKINNTEVRKFVKQ